MRTYWLHLLNILINLFDLQYSNLPQHFCIITVVTNEYIYPRYFSESVYEIGKWLICNDSNVNLYNLGVNATQ